jgi:bifunctional DNase/RNase
MLRPMVISKLAVDSCGKSCVVILKEVDGERSIPIWMGLLEANAIASELEGIKFSRPITHDLVKNIMDSIDVKVKRVEICDLKNNTYFGLIHISHNGKEMSIDARSDAVALSLRFKAPIYVAEKVLKEFMQIKLKGEPEDKSHQGKKWREILEDMDPEDFVNT